MSILRVTPEKEITFRGTDFSSTKTEILKLENLSNTNVAFKVKTTALKAYLVRPSSHVLKPGESIDVQVMLQRLGADVPQNYQHRFLVQALTTTSDTIESRDQWFALAKESPVVEFRLAVVFPDVNGGGNQDGAGGQGSSSRNLKDKYDEIVRYTRRLNEQKDSVEAEIKYIRQQAKSAVGDTKGRFQLWHIVLICVMVLVLMKFLEKSKMLPF